MLLRVGRATVVRWCESGLMGCLRTPAGHRRIPYAEVERAMQSFTETRERRLRAVGD
jgi:excisionase family DNA binding protein